MKSEKEPLYKKKLRKKSHKIYKPGCISKEVSHPQSFFWGRCHPTAPTQEKHVELLGSPEDEDDDVHEDYHGDGYLNTITAFIVM